VGGGASFNLQLPMGVGHPVFNRNWQTVDTINNRGNSFLFQGTKTFRAHFIYCKVYTILLLYYGLKR